MQPVSLAPDTTAAAAELLFAELCRAAIPSGDTRAFPVGPNGAAGPIARDIDGGIAGIVLALAQAAAELQHPEIHDTLNAATTWLAQSEPLPGGPLPGLYVGEGGVALALLSAGRVLHRDGWIATAQARAEQIARTPHHSPDLFNGTAGRARVHLALWRTAHQQAQLDAAIAAGEHLLATAEPADDELSWCIPAKDYGSASGKTYLGYAHGAAGIADALLDLYEDTTDTRYARAAAHAANWIGRRAIPSLEHGAGLDWPVTESGRRIGGMWCHGAAGVGRFFLHCAALDLFPGALDTARRAAATAARGIRWAGPTQCHGLSGSAELLLDLYRATGEETWLDEARGLIPLILPFAVAPELDYMTGKAGIAACLLRLANPDRLPHLVSLAAVAPPPEPHHPRSPTSAAPLQQPSPLPAFNALLQPDIQRMVRAGNFSAIASWCSTASTQRLLRAATDELPDIAHTSFRTFHEGVVSRQQADATLTPDLRLEPSTLADFGAALREAGYDNSPDSSQLARFALGHPVAEAELPAVLLDALTAAELATRRNGACQLRFAIVAIGDTLAAVPRGGPCADLVYVGPDSQVLLEAALRLAPSGGRALDIGTGTGLSAAVLSTRYETVVATDIQLPILRCAALTFALNGSSIRGRSYPLVADVSAGLREGAFDLVIGNPPWVPSSAANKRLYADGGPTGFDLPKRFVWESAHLLRPGGLALLLTSDATFADGSRPLQESCTALRDQGFRVSVIPVDAPGSRESLNEHIAAARERDPSPHDITEIRVVTLVIHHPSGDPDEAAALDAAMTALARRWKGLLSRS